MLTLTVNLEAPGRGTFDVVASLSERFPDCVIKVRSSTTVYKDPAGDDVEARTFIGQVFGAYASGGQSIKDKLYSLSEQFGQDCIAYKMREYGACAADLVGPQAAKWLPFSNEFFLEY